MIAKRNDFLENHMSEFANEPPPPVVHACKGKGGPRKKRGQWVTGSKRIERKPPPTVNDPHHKILDEAWQSSASVFYPAICRTRLLPIFHFLPPLKPAKHHLFRHVSPRGAKIPHDAAVHPLSSLRVDHASASGFFLFWFFRRDSELDRLQTLRTTPVRRDPHQKDRMEKRKSSIPKTTRLFRGVRVLCER